ncbi:serine/threonine-protein kinase Nek11 isoform X1 [Caretta caretta]|uniref:serine/threonine-protein kinase Nek11 isoform X1 n=1 Tax=Caretta caretta TaxID=8467 RepID=UPI0020946A77|nr:serine/threonine-protein kinase Nek11 isoform X1 [Caretta caretta]XP_048694710.1 serine/threonine-protein kinase Nek11 isoform X1 [Caretta caretta]
MLKFQEAVKHVSGSAPISTCSETLIARRYVLQQKLGRGSFGTVYLVSDKKAKQGEELKVLKEISVGDLNPNETVEANLEAQLLSKLDHPAIVKFYVSFVERESFCIITEYCEGRDLDCKIQEYKEAKKIFTESQIIEWFIQLLLGVNYMHERRILHRDLKAKNIFLKNNLLKIGDFGVSRLLMGSCDLATTFTGTPYYMSPEALKHQGYDTKSDIWSLGCILYEMCCLDHAFTGHNFLSIVLKIVEGNTPSLPDRYPSKLNTVLHSMLNKNPSLRPSATEILKIPYIDEQLQQNVKCKFINMALKDKTFNCQKEAARIVNAVQKKVHLQTLQELSEVQKMTPRERMRLRKLNAADEKAKKLKQLAEEKYQENLKRMQELRSRNFQQLSIDVLHESDEQTSKHLIQSQPVTALDYISIGHKEPSENETPGRLCMSEPVEHEIPEDPQIAEEYYNDVFDSCSETSEEEEQSEEEENMEVSQTVSKTNQQDSDVKAMVRYLENVLNNSSLGSGTVTSVAPVVPQGSRAINNTMAETKLKRMRESAIQKLGAEVFEKVYSYLKKARQQNASEDEIRECLEKVVSRASDCFEVDQLLYFEDQLLALAPV